MSKTGLVDLEELKTLLDEKTAVFMITNPNTLGLFETQITQIAKMLHDVGGLVYIDGANMNAILGIARPGDFGGDMMHFNVHKTFTGPHGAGGPGAGPVAVRDFLAPYLPGPVVSRHESRRAEPTFRLTTPAKSIGRMRTFFGNVGILLRGYMYIRTLGPAGLKAVATNAVLNANYLMDKTQGRASHVRTGSTACTSSSPRLDTLQMSGEFRRWISPSGCSITDFMRRRSISRWSCPKR